LLAQGEGQLTAAERRFASLRLSSDVQEILDRVPRDKRWVPRAKALVIFARLSLNFYKMWRDFVKQLGLGLSTGPDVIANLASVLPFAEFAVYLLMVVSGCWGILRCCTLDPHLGYVHRNNLRWRSGALGAKRLRQAAGFSALKLLDGFRRLVPELAAKWNLMVARHANSKRAALRGECLYLLQTFLFEFGKGVIGIFAFAAKLHQCGETIDAVELLGLTNQVINIVDVQGIEQGAVERFVFTGRDAKWQDDEVDALREFQGRVLKHCVRHAADVPSGFATYAWMGAEDLQKLIITEEE